MKLPMKLSLSGLSVLGLAVVLSLTFQAHGQRRSSNRYGRTDNGAYGRDAGGGSAPGVPPTPAFERAPAPAAAAPSTLPASPATAPATRPAMAAAESTEPLAPIMHGKPLPADYQVLLRKSIFDKDRRTYNPLSQGFGYQRPVTPTVRMPAVPVVRGYLSGDTGYVAYIEDPDTGKLWAFAPGDQISPEYGYVAEVTRDDIEVVKEGSPPRRIAYGLDLKGETPAAPVYSSIPSSISSSTSSTSSAAAGAATSPAGPVDTSNLSTEEKMKLRRQQQMGQ